MVGSLGSFFRTECSAECKRRPALTKIILFLRGATGRVQSLLDQIGQAGDVVEREHVLAHVVLNGQTKVVAEVSVKIGKQKADFLLQPGEQNGYFVKVNGVLVVQTIGDFEREIFLYQFKCCGVVPELELFGQIND
ncbi:hypothetical protein BpHYR1_035677 [Brachionus plicatilis]|uniref:Uncharacterized protein n=1 Tax=Brachionus plicatilis TaxID=10195 RepID=A0A3M7QLD6_BRAPC|nr:hypothetical protein BpHYR1_035677 [Brachionus plicatilis]